jgi:hypothetical protein
LALIFKPQGTLGFSQGTQITDNKKLMLCEHCAFFAIVAVKHTF